MRKSIILILISSLVILVVGCNPTENEDNQNVHLRQMATHARNMRFEIQTSEVTDEKK